MARRRRAGRAGRRGTRRLRVAFGRVAQETNACSPLPTRLDDFRRLHWLEGEALLAACQPGRPEVAGFARRAELSGFVAALRRHGEGRVEPVPLISAGAVPGGPLRAPTFAALRDRLLAALDAAGPVDAVMLALHGSMAAAGHPEADVELLRAVRDRVGPDVPVAATMDLHAHIHRRVLAEVDLVVGYRTNPHRDHFRTGLRAGRALLRVLLDGARPTTAWRSLPMIVGGGTTIDLLPPMAPIFRRLRALDDEPGILAASVFACQPWSRAPEPAWAPVVVADARVPGARERAEAAAEELAEALWAARTLLPPEPLAIDAAIEGARRAAAARALGTVCLCDASDAVGAGAPGENTAVLRALLERGRDMRSYVPLRDPEAVAAAFAAGEGGRFAGAVGGRLDPETSPPLPVEGRVRRLAPAGPFGRAAVVELGPVALVLTEAPPMVSKPRFFRELGLPILAAGVVVVKTLFPFRLYFAAYNRKTIYARTRGATDLRAALSRPADGPVWPRDPVEDWREADRRRRIEADGAR